MCADTSPPPGRDPYLSLSSLPFLILRGSGSGFVGCCLLRSISLGCASGFAVCLWLALSFIDDEEIIPSSRFTTLGRSLSMPIAIRNSLPETLQYNKLCAPGCALLQKGILFAELAGSTFIGAFLDKHLRCVVSPSLTCTIQRCVAEGVSGFNVSRAAQ